MSVVEKSYLFYQMTCLAFLGKFPHRCSRVSITGNFSMHSLVSWQATNFSSGHILNWTSTDEPEMLIPPSDSLLCESRSRQRALRCIIGEFPRSICCFSHSWMCACACVGRLYCALLWLLVQQLRYMEGEFEDHMLQWWWREWTLIMFFAYYCLIHLLLYSL